ncbi:3517_t:CDS:2, partial [Scutellospora calospora]
MANSINFCPWCQCKKTDLGNLKKHSWTIEKDMNIIASNYLAYPVPDELHIMLRITDRLWSLIISELEQNEEYNNDIYETICNEMKKCKNKFDQLYCVIKNPDIDFTQFALDAKEWE